MGSCNFGMEWDENRLEKVSHDLLKEEVIEVIYCCS